MDKISIKIVCIAQGKRLVKELIINRGSTIEQIINHNLDILPDINNIKYGIWGEIRKADTLLKNGDRLEIYLPLLTDPKNTRANRKNKILLDANKC